MFHSTKHQGFTLLEALVALVILSGIFSVVWGWFNTAAQSTLAIERSVALPAVFDRFMDKLRLENLESKRQGRYEFNGYRIDWQLSLNRDSRNEAFRKQPKWVVALFDVTAQVYNSSGKKITEFDTKYTAFWRGQQTVEDIFGNAR